KEGVLMVNPALQGMPTEPSPDTLEDLCNRLLRISTQAEIDLDVARVIRELETRSILDQLPELIYVTDRRGRFVFANAAAGRNNPLADAASLIGKTDFEILDHETSRRLFIAEQEVMSTGNAINGMEERVRLLDGRVLWLTTTKTPLRDSS